jgi:hypothetical protein
VTPSALALGGTTVSVPLRGPSYGTRVPAGFGVTDDTDWAASVRQHEKYHSAARIKAATSC